MSSSTDVISALDVALRVAAALESIRCEYFIGGSLASSLQGEPRATNDIDLVVIACSKAGDKAKGAVLASDAFL
ncbi:MAG: hypothetical protein R3B70_20840 [Polyangiaceae bacterium]